MIFKNIFTNYNVQFQNFFPKLLVAILVLIIGWWFAGKFAKIINKAMKKAKIDGGIISFSNSILKVLFRLFVILAAVSTLGVNVTSIIATLGAAFVTIGIALKDSLSNVASGTVIIINKPFRVGDYLELAELSGTVKSIEIMFTTLVTPDNRELIVPNSKLTSEYIINCSKQKNRRLDLVYSISNFSDLSKIKAIFEGVISKNDKILQNPSSKIIVNKYNSKGVELNIRLWCLGTNYNELKSEFQESIQYELEKNGVSM
ncbi:MAG: Small-conductance mechanosensitive channel [Eubacteriales bacterium SKADARSKE-1]|nr:Small-conductance mechanosensitive channel [Eubacteriales bacterium SKADARSKE-1]